MGFKENIKSIFTTNEVKASRTAPMLIQFGNHQPSFTPRQYDRLADEGYQKNIIAYRCIRLISQNAAAVPLVVHQGIGNEKTKLDENHELVKLLKSPNPNQGGTELFESIFSFLLISGNSYLETVGDDLSSPRELWSMRPDRIRVIPGVHGVPEAYRYSVNGKHIDFKVDPVTGRADILHIKNFHPLNDWYGMSSLEAAAISIDQHNDAARWNASLLQTSGRPSGAIIYNPSGDSPSDVMTEDQRNNLKLEMEDFFSGADNAGRPMVLEGGLDWKEMALSPKDMDWLAGKDVSAREIALAFNVPAQLIGINGSQTYANFGQARLALYDDAVLPMLNHIVDELNNWLCPQFGDDISISYDIDNIEALSPRRKEMWDRVNGASFMTLNEKRIVMGLEAIEGGDQFNDSTNSI